MKAAGRSLCGCLALMAVGCTGPGPVRALCSNADGSLLPRGAVCRASRGSCDVEEVCTGTSANCPDDTFIAAGVMCREAAGACDVAEQCSGSSADCPVDAFAAEGIECRASAGACDAPEVCSGRSRSCPADVLAEAGSVCRKAAGPCDTAEQCSGTTAECPPDTMMTAGTECRPAAGACDVAEACTGDSVSCPGDQFRSSEVSCRAAAGPCDVAESCTGGSAECPADVLRDASVTCRASRGACDLAEACSGNSPDCPDDALAANDVVCRAAAGVCDLEERCSGSSATCPSDARRSAGTVCRASAGDCDVAERCNGTSASCPADVLRASGEQCRPSAGACDLSEACTGTSADCPDDRFRSASTVWRAPAGACDVSESCTGTSATCPADRLAAASVVCRQSSGACDAAETCTGASTQCPANAYSPAGSTCAVSGGNACDGQGTCVVCANLCQQQVTCAAGRTTSLSGTVFMPNGGDPLPETLVFVPNAPLQPMPTGVSTCQPCGALVTGSPLVSTTTDVDGRFTLTNVPVGSHLPLVIQRGKWRRQFDVSTVTACTDTSVGALRMPANRNEGDLPKIALVTGGFGAYECVLLKLGISPQEFGNGSPTSDLRVQFFVSDGNPGAHYDVNTPPESSLWGSQQTLDQYDQVIFGCEGGLFPRTVDAQQRLLRYVNAGGRALVNHYALEWIRNVEPLWGTARWNVGQEGAFASDPQPAFIDRSFPAGDRLARWLALTDPSGVPGEVSVRLLYDDFDAVVSPARLWMSVHDPMHQSPVPMQYSFDTPVGAPPAQQCGRVLYTEFHTMEHFPSETLFPTACSTSPLRPDERLIEFMLFEQDACAAQP